MKINLSKTINRLQSLLIKYFKIIVIIIVIVILVIGFLFIIKPKWEEVKETGVFDLNMEKEKRDENEFYLSKLKKSLEKFNKINQEDIDNLSKIIPDKKEIPQLFVILEDLVNSQALSLDSVSFSEGGTLSKNEKLDEDFLSSLNAKQAKAISNSAVSKNIYILDISLNISGGRDYNDFKKLLDTIEKEQRIMDIASLSFNPGTQGAVESNMSFSISLKTYYIDGENNE